MNEKYRNKEKGLDSGYASVHMQQFSVINKDILKLVRTGILHIVPILAFC